MKDQGLTEPHDETVILMPVFVGKPEFAADLERALGVLQAASRADAGCVTYAVMADLDDPSTFILYEEWTNQETLIRHNQEQHVIDFVALADHLLAEPFRVQRLRNVV